MKKLFFLMVLAVAVFAQIRVVSVNVNGFGSSEEEAVKNALVQALQQVNGLSIYSAKSIVKQSVKGKILVNHSKNVIKLSSTSHTSAISTKSSGAIQSYWISSIKKVAEGYKADLTVNIAKYTSPGLNPRKRRSLAVLPFEHKKLYKIDGMLLDGKALSQRVTQSIVTKITQTRKFTVLDRQNSNYYNYEKSFLLSGNSDVVELSRLGKRLGADYFIIGQILDIGAQNQVSSNYYTSEVSAENHAFATVAYRILNIPTQQIKWSDTIDIDFDIPNSKRVESLLVKLGDRIAQVLTEQIIFNIYPPRIIRKDANRVIINIGGNFLHKGDHFKVFADGKKLYDPYTKESLGRDEIETGKIKIVSVKPKIAYGEVIEGNVKVGSVLRKEKRQTEAPDGEKDSMFEMMFPQ